MVEGDQEPDSSAARELASFLAGLVLALLLAHACIWIPLVAALFVSPWLGATAALGSILVWARIGPQPGPGLVQGTLCLSGLAAILGTLLVCLVWAIRDLFV